MNWIYYQSVQSQSSQYRQVWLSVKFLNYALIFKVVIIYWLILLYEQIELTIDPCDFYYHSNYIFQ